MEHHGHGTAVETAIDPMAAEDSRVDTLAALIVLVALASFCLLIASSFDGVF